MIKYFLFWLIWHRSRSKIKHKGIVGYTSLRIRAIQYMQPAPPPPNRWHFLRESPIDKIFWIIYILCTPRTSRSTYRPTLDRCIIRHIGQVSTNVLIDRHIGRVSVDMSTEMCRSTYRPMYQPNYRPSDGQLINRLSADISVDIAADTRPIRWPLIVGGILVDCRWYIGQNLRL